MADNMTNDSASNDPPLPPWQVTAQTVYCDEVQHQATIMIYKDWGTACSYHKIWGPVISIEKHGISRIISLLTIRSPKKRIRSKCPGPETCEVITSYRDKLYIEEVENQATS